MKTLICKLMMAGLVFGLAGCGGDESADAGSGAEEVWTCSMHPQIRQPNEGDCPICGMDLILLDPSAAGLGERELTLSPEAAALANLQTAPVRRDWANIQVSLVGKVAIDETKVSTLTARFPARLDELYVDYTGITVRKGDHLAKVYSPDLLIAQQELIGARGASAEAARAKLRLWGIPETRIKEITSTGKASDQFDIDAPVGGVVTEMFVREGDYVKTGDRLFRLTSFDDLWVVFDAYETDLPWLRFGQDLKFTVDAVPGKKFTGKISYIDPMLNATTRTSGIRLNVKNADGLLKPGMLASGKVSTRVAVGGKVIASDLAGKWISPMHPEIVKDGPGQCDICGMDLVRVEDLGYSTADDLTGAKPLLVPSSAVLRTGERAVVYVEKQDADRPVYEARTILLGARAGDDFIVADGLKEGESVVVNGAFKLDSELQISGKESMMQPKGSGEDLIAKRTGSPAATKQVSEWLGQYFELQQALANDDATAAKSVAKSLSDALKSETPEDLSEQDSVAWTTIVGEMREAATPIAEAEDIKLARQHFETVTMQLLALAKTFGSGQGKVFIVHCPMAFGNKGADWLSAKDEVLNPYFGDMMLRCGEVKEELGE